MIYFIQETGRETNHIKIGFTRNKAEKRMQSMQTANPSKLKLLLAIKGNQSLEKSLHNKFSEDNVIGEWFYPSKKLQEYINLQARVQGETLCIENSFPLKSYYNHIIDFAKFDLHNPDHHIILIIVSAILLAPFLLLAPEAIAEMFIPALIILRIILLILVNFASELGVSLSTVKRDVKTLNGSVQKKEL